MNCGIFDGARFFAVALAFEVSLVDVSLVGASLVDGRPTAVSEDALLVFPLALPFECQTASDAAAWPDTMNGFGRGPSPASIFSSVRPEATERSSSVTASPFSRA